MRPSVLKRSLYGALGAVLLVLESLAAAGFVWLEIDPRRHLLSLGLLSLTAAAILALLISLGARVLARRTGRTPSAFTPALAAGLSPLILLGLVFLQFIVFLRDLRPVLPWLSVLGSFYLLGASVARALASAPRPEGRRDRGPRPRPRAVSFLVYVPGFRPDPSAPAVLGRRAALPHHHAEPPCRRRHRRLQRLSAR
jgi:hypothetical protein